MLIIYYIKLSSSIVCCLLSGDTNLSFGAYIDISAVSEAVSTALYGEVPVILSAILLLIKSLVASPVFFIDFSEAVLSASVAGYLA